LIQARKNSLLAVISAAILASGAAVVIASLDAMQYSAVAYPQQQQQQKGYSHYGMMKPPGVYAAGTIASLQNDQNGNPTWIVSGYWKGSLTMDNKTKGGGGGGIGTGNQTTTTTTANATTNTNSTVTTTTAGNLTTARFNAMFNMVMTNGSAMHKHAIYNFKLMNMSNPNNTTSVFNGTATITMKEGPVDNVPLSIKRIDNNVISIWADPAKVNNHFGNTPIYGTIIKSVIVEK
jgi:hypothetical protein